MKFWEAMKALEEGNKVRCVTWEPSWYADRQGNLAQGIDCNVYLDEKWELYEKAKSSRQEIAEKAYSQICAAIDELKNSGVQAQYPANIWVDEEEFQFPKTLSFAEGVKGLKEGKKFRRECWHSYIFAHLQNGVLRNQEGYSFQWDVEDFEATDWVEVKE